MRDMTAKELDLYYREHVCPSCGKWDFLNGPSGGGTINIKCDTCGMELSVDDSHLCWSQGKVLSEPDGYTIPQDDLPEEVEEPTTVVVAAPKRTWRTLWF